MPRTFTLVRRRSRGTVSRSAREGNNAGPVRSRTWPFGSVVRVVVLANARCWYQPPLSPAGWRPASRNRAEMKRAARASPAVATRRPSMESCASAVRRLRVRSIVATGGLAAVVDGDGVAEQAAQRIAVKAEIERRLMTLGGGDDRYTRTRAGNYRSSLAVVSRAPRAGRRRRGRASRQ